MRRFFAVCLAILACDCTLVAAQEGLRLESIKRIYVAQFAVKRGSDSLRNDVIAQLRKMSSITIVPVPSDADAILEGDGEIWIKGYQSLNPRSGRLPYDGTPFYSGFLSVELKDPKGDTLWSDLVTPGAPSANISKELSRRLQRSLAEALVNRPPTSHP